MQIYPEFLLMTLMDRYACLTIISGENPLRWQWKGTFECIHFIILSKATRGLEPVTEERY
jgi:hypothetical protein